MLLTGNTNLCALAPGERLVHSPINANEQPGLAETSSQH